MQPPPTNDVSITPKPLPNALSRLPVELWMKIFENVSTKLAPTRNGTFLQDFDLMRNWKEGDHQAAITTATSSRTTLSLVCKHFCDILADMGDRVAIVGRGEDLKTLGIQEIEGAKSLFLYAWKNRPPPQLQDVELHALTFLYVEDLAFDLSDIFDRSPRLLALSIGIPYSMCSVYMALSHPVAHQLTHFSLTMKLGMWLEHISLPSLRFLRMGFMHWHDYTSTAKTSRAEVVPWVLPQLSSLALCGDMDEGWFKVLVPFLQQHHNTVIRLANDLFLYRPGKEYKAVTASYFSALKLYRGDINELFTLEHHSNGFERSSSLALTMLITSHSMRTLSKRIKNGDLTILHTSEQPGICIPGTTYVVTRVMVCWPWEQMALHLGEYATQTYASSFEWLHSYGVRVVDCDSVDLDDFASFWLPSQRARIFTPDKLTAISHPETPVSSLPLVDAPSAVLYHEIGRLLLTSWSMPYHFLVGVVGTASLLLGAVILLLLEPNLFVTEF